MQALDNPIIDALESAERARLLDRSVPRRLTRGEALYLAGDRGRRLHVIVSGVIKFTARDGSGAETILGLATPGQLVGEIAAVDGCQQPLDAVAATACDVLGLDAELFLELATTNPAAGVELARAMAARTRWLIDTALERTSSEVPARVAGRLLDLADLLGRIEAGAIEMDLPLAQGDLGQLAGVCRESACRTLRRFKQQGVLDYRGRRLRVLRPDVLERIRCAGRASEPSP